jgi:hypothetical protein
VCVFVMGPPGERRTHLRILSRLGQLVLLPGFLFEIRTATAPWQVRRIMQAAEATLALLEESDELDRLKAADLAPMDEPDDLGPLDESDDPDQSEQAGGATPAGWVEAGG